MTVGLKEILEEEIVKVAMMPERRIPSKRHFRNRIHEKIFVMKK
jgi:hypothetical protein